jgi:hypothetical protein
MTVITIPAGTIVSQTIETQGRGMDLQSYVPVPVTVTIQATLSPLEVTYFYRSGTRFYEVNAADVEVA